MTDPFLFAADRRQGDRRDAARRESDHVAQMRRRMHLNCEDPARIALLTLAAERAGAEDRRRVQRIKELIAGMQPRAGSWAR